MPSVATPSASAVWWMVIRTPPPTPARVVGTSASAIRNSGLMISPSDEGGGRYQRGHAQQWPVGQHRGASMASPAPCISAPTGSTRCPRRPTSHMLNTDPTRNPNIIGSKREPAGQRAEPETLLHREDEHELAEAGEERDGQRQSTAHARQP